MAQKDEYRATDYPGIKQRIKDGKYLAVIDLGRQPKLDKKTGEMVLKQCKTQKIFDTLKEAKAYRGANDKAKSQQKVSKTAGKVTFRQAIADYDAKYSSGWGVSYTAQKKNQVRRMIAYFGDTDVRQIDTLAIEALSALTRWTFIGVKSQSISLRAKSRPSRMCFSRVLFASISNP